MAVGNTYVTACGPGPTLVYQRGRTNSLPNTTHGTTISCALPCSGPRSEVFAIGYDPTGQFGGELLKLRMTLPGT